MIPATIRFFIAVTALAMTDRRTRKMDYMGEERRILMELLHPATGKKTSCLHRGPSTSLRRKAKQRGTIKVPFPGHGC